MAYFPIFIDLKDRTVLVVGGGRIAARRIRAMEPFGCRLTVISPELSEELLPLHADGRVEWIKKAYDPSDLKRASRPVFVLAASGVREVNEAVSRDCRLLGIPVNNASEKEQCDFYFPGVAKSGEIVAGVSAGGTDHRAAAAVTAAVRRFIDQGTWRA